MPVSPAILDADPSQFLRVAAQGASVMTHADLWQWLGGDVQQLLPHELLIAAWGDFRSDAVHVDLISSLPGLRTHQAQPQRFMPLVRYLRDCWAAARYAPCQADVDAHLVQAPHEGGGAAAAPSMGLLRTAVIHGTGDAAAGGERIFAALTWRPRGTDREAQALRLLLPFIDTALRRMATLPMASQGRLQAGLLAQGVPVPVPLVGVLSARERQIMSWVAMGKTNPEIGCILRISEFTVKNHMKSIFSKLDVSNRAQAVAKLTRAAAPA